MRFKFLHSLPIPNDAIDYLYRRVVKCFFLCAFLNHAGQYVTNFDKTGKNDKLTVCTYIPTYFGFFWKIFFPLQGSLPMFSHISSRITIEKISKAYKRKIHTRITYMKNLSAAAAAKNNGNCKKQLPAAVYSSFGNSRKSMFVKFTSVPVSICLKIVALIGDIKVFINSESLIDSSLYTLIGLYGRAALNQVTLSYPKRYS